MAPKNNQYWMIETNSVEEFSDDVEDVDIPIDSSVVLMMAGEENIVECAISSMDVEALYQSIDQGEAARISINKRSWDENRETGGGEREKSATQRQGKAE